MPGMARTVITFGTFDVFHVGHLRVIERAAALGDRLVVGVSGDALNLRKKGREPVFSERERMAIVAALKPVHEVFLEESLELKRDYIRQYAADVLVMGDDWKGRFDDMRRPLRGGLPPSHARHLHHRADREDLRHRLSASLRSHRGSRRTSPSACGGPGVHVLWTGLAVGLSRRQADVGAAALASRSPASTTLGDPLMRRTLAAAVLAFATATLALPAVPTAADPGGASPTLPVLPDQAAERALEVATRVLDGKPSTTDPDATLALTDLRLALPRLTGLDKQRAESLLARPTDGNADRFGDGYAPGAKKTKKCSKYLCLHWVTKSTDADKPPAGWAGTTLTQLNKVWKKEIGGMGYKKPLGDGSKGGNSKLDVYLKDVGSKGLYGYCAPEQKKYKYTYAGYCVLDNDFDPAEFGGAPALSSLKVTAAHEFFHAVQFAYDAAEDRWFMESTATWMEERYADGINDNLQYLPYGQLGAPHESLDTFVNGGGNQYGNWAFWEYLTQRKGNSLVKNVWKKAATYKGAPDQYSTQALKTVLKNKGGFTKTFAAYANALTLPAKFWDEGSTWPGSAPLTYSHSLNSASAGAPVGNTVGLSHMASRNVRFTTGDASLVKGYRLKVAVDGPSSTTSPVAYLLVQKKDGSIVRTAISLNSTGKGTKTVGFDFVNVASVTLTLGNASTRFSCWTSGSTYSCYGVPKDENKPFAYTGTVLAPAP